MPYHKRIGNMGTLVLEIQDNKNDQPENKLVPDLNPLNCTSREIK